MSSKPFVYLSLLFGCAAAGGCAAPAEKNKAYLLQAGGAICSEPRSAACRRDYRPVCGQLQSGTQQTFANACVACSDPQVVGHLPGACEQQ